MKKPASLEGRTELPPLDNPRNQDEVCELRQADPTVRGAALDIGAWAAGLGAVRKHLSHEWSQALLTYFLAQVFNSLMQFGADALISRHLGPADRGLWFGFHTMLLFLANLLSLALPISCYYFVGNRRVGLDRVNSACLMMVSVLLISLLASAPLLAALVGTLPDFSWAAKVVLLAVILLCIEIYALCWYGMMMGIRAVRTVVAGNLASSAFFVVTIIALASTRTLDLMTTFFSYFYYRLALLGYVLWVLRRGSHLHMRMEWKLLREMAFFGAKAQVASLFTMAFLRTIFFYVYHFHGVSDLGLLGVAYGLAERIGLVFNAVQFVFAREIVGSELQAARQRTWQIVRFVLISSSVLFLPLIAAGIFLIPLLYGEPFRGATTAFIVLAAGMVLQGSNQIVGTFVNGRLGRPEINAWIAFFSLILCTVFGFFLVRHGGLWGGSLMITLTYAFQFAAALVPFWGLAGTGSVEEPRQVESASP